MKRKADGSSVRVGTYMLKRLLALLGAALLCLLLGGALGEDELKMGLGEPGVYIACDTPGAAFFSSDESVAKVNASTGEITALKTGVCRVYAEADGQELLSRTLRVMKAPSSLTLPDKKQEIMLGTSALPLTWEAGPGEWPGTPEVRVSGTAARLTKDGLLYGADIGSVTVTLKSYNGLKVTYTAYVRIKPSSVRLSADRIDSGVGESFSVEYEFSPAYSFSRVTYFFDREKLRFDEQTGRFTALAEGETEIVITAENGLSAVCCVRVMPLPDRIDAPDRVRAAVGSEGTLSCGLPENTWARLKYESLTPDVVSISADGRWHMKNEGEGTVRVRAEGTDVSADVAFEAVPAARKIEIVCEEARMCVGQTLQLGIKAQPEGSFEGVEWKSSNPRCVQADASGTLTALAQGSSVITAVSFNGVKATLNVSVLPQPDEIRLDATFISLLPGESRRLSGSFSRNAYTVISFSSLDTSIAEVDRETGEVTGVGFGTTAVVARSLNGKTATCLVSVEGESGAEPELEIVFMDIDTNDGILLRSGEEYAFIDSGSHPYGEKAAEFIRSRGITHLKYYIGTHAHLDHIGGACVILEAFDVDMVIMPHALVETAIRGSVWTDNERQAVQKAVYCILRPGETIYLGSAPFLCIGPVTVKNVKTTDHAENDNSLVLRAEVGETSILLTGDATIVEFNAIIREFPDKIRCDVYKNTHHAGELNDEQIKMIAPRIAVFSTSSLRLPSDRYRGLFERLGSEIYITAERVNGNVTLYTDGKDITVTPQYEDNRAAWAASNEVFGGHGK
ncbi:MAG: Ig-like domain-containing protein [Clostridia bacterium]|nr:Ig-like domain-containing protein [Clostridia bacterium]